MCTSTIEDYDPVGRLKQRTTTAAGGATLVDYRYTFDLAGQVTTESHHGQSTTYSHDLAGQLLTADRTGQADESYSYDPAGNHTGNGQVVDASNRIISDDRFDYAYDDEGNLVEKTEPTGEVTTFSYDFRNRLTEVTRTSAGGLVLSHSTYTYDVFDRVIAREVNGVRLMTVYDGDNPWADFDASGSVEARYLYGDGADEILARWRPGDGQAWYLADKQGTIRDLIDSAGAVIGQRDYDGFGQILAAMGAVDRFAFQGREWEAAAGLYKFRARFYDPVLRQFTSEDPLGFAAGDANLRRFVFNSPLSYTDPSGMLAITENAVFRLVSTTATEFTMCMLAGAAYKTLFSLGRVGVVEALAESEPWEYGLCFFLGTEFGIAALGRAARGGGSWVGRLFRGGSTAAESRLDRLLAADRAALNGFGGPSRAAPGVRGGAGVPDGVNPLTRPLKLADDGVWFPTRQAAARAEAAGYRIVCFAAGTPLLAPTGARPIEEFRVGDQLVSRSEFNPCGVLEAKSVEEVFVSSGRLFELQVGGRVIRTTGEHPFYVPARGWTPVRKLQVGDLLVSHDGQSMSVEDVRDTGEWETVYNLRIADFHTYFVGCGEWGFSVWAHNACVVPLDAAEIAANPGKTFKVVDGANVTYHANAVEAHLAATPITGAAHPGAALRQAYAAVNQSGLSVAEKTALLRGYIRNIEGQFGHTGWQLAAEEIGTDGSVIFSGQAGEAVVISPTGQLFTGSIRPNAPGFTWGPRGELTPVYTNLTPR